jgi:hypothetical protein
MMMRKWTALALSVALVATVSGTVFAAPTVPGAVYGDSQAVGVNKPVVQIQQELQQAGIQDVKATDWFAGSVTVLVQAGLLPPMADGNFHPEATLNAGDGVAVFAKVLGIASKNDTPEQAMAKAVEAGLVGADMTITHDLSRLEVARLLAKALGVEVHPVLGPDQYPFADWDAVKENLEDAALLKALYDLGIFKGYEDHTFQPFNILTRAEIAMLVDRILGAR